MRPLPRCRRSPPAISPPCGGSTTSSSARPCTAAGRSAGAGALSRSSKPETATCAPAPSTIAVRFRTSAMDGDRRDTERGTASRVRGLEPPRQRCPGRSLRRGRDVRGPAARARVAWARGHPGGQCAGDGRAVGVRCDAQPRARKRRSRAGRGDVPVAARRWRRSLRLPVRDRARVARRPHRPLHRVLRHRRTRVSAPPSVREREPLSYATRRSPYFERTLEAGAIGFMVYNHTYMPIDYGRDPVLEYRAMTRGVTLWDVGAERQAQLRGPDALSFADYLSPRDLLDLAVGRCRYTPVCDPRGQVMADCIVLRPFEDTVWYSHSDADISLWAYGLALARAADVEVQEADVAPLQLQ